MSKKKLNIVLDIGKTNVKLVFLDHKGQFFKEIKTKQTLKFYKKKISYLNSEKIINWLLLNLNKFSTVYHFKKFVCTTHGGTVAFINHHDQEILASTDYEYKYDKFSKDFQNLAPSFKTSLTPHLEGGLNVGQQIYYLKRIFPEIIENTKFILSYPQYITWKLTGNYSSEISYIGCHSFLWNFKKNNYSSLVRKLKITKKFPKFNKAWEKIGNLLIKDSKINVLNGVHDSNASYLYFKNSALKKFTLVSTGTWYIIFNQSTKISKLNPKLDMLSSIDVFGNHVPTMRFMGGREYDTLCELLKITNKTTSKINEKDLIKNLIYPSFASAGPFKINKNLLKIKKINLNNNQKYSLICIYMAFTLNFCLDYMNSSSDIILDGPLTKNNFIMGIIATLRSKQKIFSNKKQIGTSLGASLLFNIKKKSKLNLNKILILKNTNYKKLYKIWIEEIKKKNLIN